MRNLFVLITSLLAGVGSAQVLYENNFEKAEANKMPDDLMVLEGAFAVKQDGTNKFVELPGAPLETFGFLFGPTEMDSIAASARMFGSAKGRRAPSFAIGVNGVSGYKLQIAPGKKVIELVKGENEVLASAPYKWDSGSWTMLRLQVVKAKDGEWRIEGKAWGQGSPEPQSWTVSHTDKTGPIPGRAGVWGSPYSETPIRFDDLKVVRIAP